MKKLVEKPVRILIEKIAKRTAAEVAPESVATRETAVAVGRETAAALTQVVLNSAERIVDTLTERFAYLMRINKMLGSASVPEPHVLFGGVSEDFWLWLNTAGCRIIPGLTTVLPALPDKNLQLSTGPDTGNACVERGFKEYTLFKRIFETNNGALARCEAILDFGCGWGRLIRYFLKDVEPSRLCGIDPWGPGIEAARQTNKWCHFELSHATPPTSLPPDKFDLVYSYSVFSHLSEQVHLDWLLELKRILKPGGILIATTFPRDQILSYERLRKEGIPAHDQFLNDYFKIYVRLFQNPEKWLADYDAGQFCYEDFGRGDGDAVIPKAYVLAHWTKHFSFVDFIDDRNLCAQNVIVVKK
jgi:SAM-dependent methyltransferase